ncbi:MAG: hypothetical protein ABSE05_07070 [Syntrophales bacterium]|jgi:hypothetical protein
MTHPRLLAATFRPGFYPHRPEHVEFIQTHISYIFIAGDEGEASDGRWEICLAQKETFDRVTEIPEDSHIIIDTPLTPEECTYKALQKMKNFTA